MNRKQFHRVWCDGCYDVTHFGHYNFLRQAASLSDEVYAGVHSDQVIFENKHCMPVFTLEERMLMIGACKWVTKVIPDAPFFNDISLIKSLGCESSIHGDDPSFLADGTDSYAAVKAENMFTTVPRTKAISTTNLIGRMLRLPRSELPDIDPSLIIEGESVALHTYIPTTHRIAQFSEPIHAPKPNDKIVYVDGTFDLMHPGHISFLKKAKEMGDYLVVGIHDDITMGKPTNPAYPIMTLQERVLNVLSLKYVDDVIIGAPYCVTKELMEQINPDVVVEGSVPSRVGIDAFEIPKQKGIFQKIESDYPTMTTKTIVHRIMENYAMYAERNTKKEASAKAINIT